MKKTSSKHMDRTTVLVIIGAMKSGTTSLFNLLAQHPEICPSHEKEPNYFATENSPNTADYLKLWPQQVGPKKVLMEASTGYTKIPQYQGVADRMCKMDGLDFRLIYIMRHPLERIESQVRHGLYAGWNPSLDEGMRPRDNIINISRYAMQLEPYILNFDRDSILLLSLEELKANPRLLLKRVCRHIGVNSSHTFSNLHTKANNGERFQSQKIINNISSGESPLFRILRSFLSIFIGQKSSQLWRIKALQKNRGRFRLTHEEKYKILASLQPDLARLKTEHGINVDQLWEIDCAAETSKQ